MSEMDIYKNKCSKIINFVHETTGLNYNTNSKTIMVNEYVLKNSKDSTTLQTLKETKTFLMSHLKEAVILIYYVVFLVESIAYGVQFHDSFITLDLTIFPQNQYVLLFWLVSPIIIWLSSTSTVFWNYHTRKLGTLVFIIIVLSFRFATFFYIISYKLFIPFISKCKLTPTMTVNKVLGLGYIVLAIPTLISFIIILNIYLQIMKDAELKNDIKNFKITHYIHLPKSTFYSYTMSIVTNMKNGVKSTISEHDRWLHSIIVGATGTAKTSSCLLPAIYHDLRVRYRNMAKLKKICMKYIKKDKFYLTKKIKDSDFSINYVRSKKGNMKNYNQLIKKFKMAGITVIAPDDSITDKVYELTKSFNFKCNRIDPKLTPEGKLKEEFIGFNPLFISPTIPDWARTQEMVKRATLFADVMQVLNELSGTKSDPYFSSINRIATTTISMLLMLTYPRIHQGIHPTPNDVLFLLNDFDRIIPYLDELDKININNQFQTIKDVLQRDFLGVGRDTFSQHSRGLRVQLNNFLTNPLIKNVLCTQNSVDIDKALANGEITVCNIELGELGPSDSPAFGLFYSVSFINAVLRRPGNEWTRLPHFCYIDEFPVIVSPAFESCFSLFRKFRVSMNVALQTLDQLNKSPFTKHLKGVLMNSCGHHIVFGRANSTEMKEYSELAGKDIKHVVQTGISETHLSDDNPIISFSERTTPTLENIIEPNSIRNKRDFQEVTFITTREGRLLKPIHGRVFFLSKRAYSLKRKLEYMWEQHYKDEDTESSDKSETNQSVNYETIRLANNIESDVNNTPINQNDSIQSYKKAIKNFDENMNKNSEIVNIDDI